MFDCIILLVDAIKTSNHKPLLNSIKCQVFGETTEISTKETILFILDYHRVIYLLDYIELQGVLQSLNGILENNLQSIKNS